MSEPVEFLGGRVRLFAGDCAVVLRDLADNSIDSCVCDPPYALVSIGKRFGADDAAPCKPGKTGAYARASAGFMGKKWDTGETAFAIEFWCEVWRVLKPGAHVVAFGGARSFHRLACAIEDAGFEIRDQLAWAYGSGFPKSHDVSKGIDKAAGAEREVVGYGCASEGGSVQRKSRAMMPGGAGERNTIATITAPATDAARQWEGWGTALKPAWEPICLARKPLGTGNIDVRRNVENAIRERGFTGDFQWKEYVASVGRVSRKSSSQRAEQNAETSVSGANENTITNTECSAATFLEHPRASSTDFTANGISIGAREPPPHCVTQSSVTTEDHALAAEKSSRLSSRSIILGEGVQRTEDRSATESTPISNGEASRPDTESFAGIATGLSGSQAHALIKREGNLFVWPEMLPTFVPSKPLNVAANVLRWGTGAINVDGCRIESGGTHGSADSVGKGSGSPANPRVYGKGIGGVVAPPHPLGRWPANIIHDGSEEVLAAFPDTGPSPQTYIRKADGFGNANYRVGEPAGKESLTFGDSGSAARFFYSSKADADDRLGSKHPTVKPVDLMQWLCRLVTPPGGTILDPFAGTGTTGEAAWREGFNAVLVEREPEYQADIARRMFLCLSGPDERKRESIKARHGEPTDLGPLFGGNERVAS